MPELPEVETIVRALNCGGRDCLPLPGRIISRAHVLWARTIAVPDVDQFSNQVAGLTVGAVTRRGKFIQMQLDDRTMLVHLRMSGDVRVEMRKQARQAVDLKPHDRLVLDFLDGTRFVFNDTRKFGRVWLVDDPAVVLGGLGMEPLERSFTSSAFYLRLQKSSRQIKPLLLDQTVVAGIGNIYADEALHMAHVHPMTPARRIDLDRATALCGAIRKVLREGIRRNGASIDWVYRGGEFQNHFRVYQRAGKACPVCGATIERAVIGQRGTHYCPRCQVRA